jgi:hypothetical protein
MPNWLCRYLFCFPYRCLLCPVEQVSKRRRLNPVMAFTTVFFGLTITVVSEKRQKHLIRNSPIVAPLPCRIGYFAYSGTPSDFGEVPGSDDRTSPQSTIPHHTAHSVGVFQFQIVVADAIMVLPLSDPRYYLWSLTTHANRFIECITFTVGTVLRLWCVSFPRLLPWLCSVSLVSLLSFIPLSCHSSRFRAISLWSVIMRQLVPDPTAPASIRKEFILSKVGFPINTVVSSCNSRQSLGELSHLSFLDPVSACSRRVRVCGGRLQSPPFNAPFVVIHSRDQYQVMACTPGQRKCKHTSEGFDRLGTNNVPPPIHHPQNVLINPLSIANHESPGRKCLAIDVRLASGS